MKNKLLPLLSFLIGLFSNPSFAGASPNLALHLDGKDNNVKTGIGIMQGTWTLEAWIKGDGNQWKPEEVLFGGGEYSALNITDFLPLVIKNGKLHSTGANLWSADTLDDQWHHVALSCDGASSFLFLDGQLADNAPIAFSVLPGALGVNETEAGAFGGLLDEVRIWKSFLPADVIREWMFKPLTRTHRQFKQLVAYYNFDDGFTDVAVNWVGKGDQPYHLRNGRSNFRGTAPLAYTVINDNPKFHAYAGKQVLFHAVVIPSKWDSDQGSTGEQLVKLRIAVNGSSAPLSLTELTLDLSGVSNLSDIRRLYVYYTGKSARSGIRVPLFGDGFPPAKKLKLKNPGKSIPLTSGINYFLVTADISPEAAPGNKIKLAIPSMRLNNRHYLPEAAGKTIEKSVTPSRHYNFNIVKVLQWNIWHGGIHLADNGLNRVIELIKASNADVITMQEAYGSQRQIADSLGYRMHSATDTDNLALFSRYPLTPLPSFNTMNSNPARINLPNGRELLINGCWLRYARKPEYTWCYPNKGQNPQNWIAEDSTLALEDIRDVVEKDVRPHFRPGSAVVIGGDFNSSSHLDWTLRAAPLHFGYGPVAFPVSKYLAEEGYLDSFREINPDEVNRPEGTFAPIYGHLWANRIDFIYYKGNNSKAVVSKIIKTAPEIDDVWASDHAAVLTTFEISPP